MSATWVLRPVRSGRPISIEVRLESEAAPPPPPILIKTPSSAVPQATTAETPSNINVVLSPENVHIVKNLSTRHIKFQREHDIGCKGCTAHNRLFSKGLYLLKIVDGLDRSLL